MYGKLVVIEGLDGAGITTQATLLRNYFLKKGQHAVLTKEPTDGLIGGLIKACLRHEWRTKAMTLQMLFAADRSHHLAEEIEPALSQGKTVICDRYILSSLVFGSLDVSLNILAQLNTYFRKPDVTFIIDTQPRICIERIKKARPHVELYEDEQRLEQTRRNFLSLKNYFSETYIVDGNRSPREILSDVVRILQKVKID